jgi:hypothetical protein
MQMLGWAGMACLLACTGCEALFPTDLAPDDAGVDGSRPDASIATDGASSDGPVTDTAAPSGDSSLSQDGASTGDSSPDLDAGACAPDASQSCGCGGTQQCGADHLWGGCNTPDCPSGVICDNGTCCGSPSECAPGATQSPTCAAGAACGNQPETCSACGQWVAQGACTGQTGCTPGSQQACNTYGTQTCQSDCTWSGCTCPNAPVCVPWSLVAVTGGQLPGDGPLCAGTDNGASCCITGNNVCGGAECCGNEGMVCDPCGQCGVMQCLCLC